VGVGREVGAQRPNVDASRLMWNASVLMWSLRL